MSRFTPSAEQQYEAKRQYGTGWGSVIKTLGGIAATGAAPSSGDAAAAAEGAALIGEGVKDFIGGIKKQKQIQESGIQVPSNANNKNSSNKLQLKTTKADQAMLNTGYDTNAGYNPQSESFRDGNGNVVFNQHLPFEEQAAQQPLPALNPALTETKTVPTISGGKKINYLKFFS